MAQSTAEGANGSNRGTYLDRTGWSEILRGSVRQFKRHDMADRAAALTYYGVLAIFPGLLVLVSILGLVGRSATQTLLNNIGQIAPGGVSGVLRTVVMQVQGRSGAASVAAVAGLILALWSASGYVAGFIRASNVSYEVAEGRPIWKTAPLRLAVTLALVIMLVISAVMVVVSGPVATQLGRALGLGSAVVLVWDVAKWPVLLIVVSLMFSLLYRACPNVRQPGARWITPGGVLAVLVWLIASGLFAVYIGFSGSYNKTYGSLASVIVFLVWLWITNISVLFGAEFNAESQRRRAIAAGLPEGVEPFAELRDTRKLDAPERRRVQRAGRARESGLQMRRRRRGSA
ncbi:MAG: YihY/virulence factor BrkB family protein [Sciscionella sp.]